MLECVGQSQAGAQSRDFGLGWHLASLGQRVATGFRRVLPANVHPRQYAVLQYLLLQCQSGVGVADSPTAGSHITQSQLARDLGIPPGRLVGLIDDLESRGWIRREATPGDRRTYGLTLTEQGRTAAEDLVRVAQAYEDSLTRELDERQRETLTRLLARLRLPGESQAPHVW